VQVVIEQAVHRAAEQATATLRDLARRPLSLLLAMLALNALAAPYAGLMHDARLYAAQVWHRLDERAFADDLFFLYGSQDQFSIFSRVVAPVAAMVGVPAAFFLFYLAGKALYFLAALRLVFRLVPGRVLAVVSLLLLAVSSIPYGGFGVFGVNEPFFTPRPIATACVLLGVERVLAGRFGLAFLVVLVGGLMHPIIAVPGLAIVVVSWARARLPGRVFWTLSAIGGLALGIVLASPPLAGRLFGQMDEDWLMTARHASPYASPLDWPTFDLAASFGPPLVLLAAAWVNRRRRLAGVALLAVLVGWGGLAASVLGSLMGYALLVQGQFYRALWLVNFLQMPLGLWLMWQLWHSGEIGRCPDWGVRSTSKESLASALGPQIRTSPATSRLAAVALACWLLLSRYEIELLLFLWPLPVIGLHLRGLGRQPRTAGWLWKSALASLLFAIVVGAALRFYLIIHWRSTLLARVEDLDYCRVLLGAPGFALWALAGLAGVTALRGWLGSGAGFRRLFGPVFLTIQLTAFVAPLTSYYQQHCRYDRDDIAFVANYVNEARDPSAGRPTLYWSNTSLGTLWIDLHAKSYYQLQQVQGLLFSRAEAVEAHRRARVVRRFELDHWKKEKEFIPADWLNLLQGFHECDLERSRPTRADLERLCREQALDFAILPQAFEGLYAATNGRLYIYDCRRLRQHLSACRPKPTGPGPS
jgi:hypothetical protein